MAVEKQIEINVNASGTGIDELGSKISKLDNNIQKAESQHKSLTKSFSNGTSAVLENGVAMGLLNDLTGGYAMMAKDAVEASGLFGSSLGKVGVAFQNMSKVAKAAIISTGIGVLIVALGAVVAYWDDIKGAISGVSSEQQKLNEQTQKNLDMQNEKLESINSQDNILKLQGKSEKEIAELKAKQTKETIKATEALILQQEETKKAQVEAAKRNKDILEGVLKFISIPLTLILKSVDLVGKALGKDFGLEDKIFGSVSKLIFDPEEVAAEGDKTINESKKKLQKLQNDYAGHQLAINEINKKAVEDAKKARDEAAQKEKERLDKISELQRNYAKQAEDLNAKTEEEKLALAEKRANAEFDALNATEQQKAEMRAYFDAQELELQKKHNEELARLEDEKNIAFQDLALAKKQWEIDNIEDLPTKLEKQKEFNEQELELLLERQQSVIDDVNATAQAKNDAEIQVATLKQDYLIRNAELDKQLSEEEKTRARLVGEARVAAAEQTLSLLANLANEGSALAKGVAVAQAIMDTYKGAVAAYAAGSSVGGPAGIVLGPVMAGLAVAAGLANIKKIVSTKPIERGSGSASASVPAPPPPPQFNIVGQSGNNQLAQSIGNQQNRPVRAFVVGNEVTTQQALDRNRVQTASFG